MNQPHHIDALETVYDELRKVNPQEADKLGVVIDRIEDGMALGQDHSKILELYVG